MPPYNNNNNNTNTEAFGNTTYRAQHSGRYSSRGPRTCISSRIFLRRSTLNALSPTLVCVWSSVLSDGLSTGEEGSNDINIWEKNTQKNAIRGERGAGTGNRTGSSALAATEGIGVTTRARAPGKGETKRFAPPPEAMDARNPSNQPAAQPTTTIGLP